MRQSRKIESSCLPALSTRNCRAMEHSESSPCLAPRQMSVGMSQSQTDPRSCVSISGMTLGSGVSDEIAAPSRPCVTIFPPASHSEGGRITGKENRCPRRNQPHASEGLCGEGSNQKVQFAYQHRPLSPGWENRLSLADHLLNPPSTTGK